MKKSLFLALFFVFVLICHSALFAQVEDITPPAVQSLDFTPKMIDISAGSQSITVTARITDDLSGFLWGNMLFQSPSQIQVRGGSFDSWTIISGDIYNGVYEFTINVPQYAEAGEWRVLYFGGSDTTGNARYYYTEELAALGFPTVLTVSGGPDLAPPIIASLNFTPKAIDVSAGSQSITVTARITDDLSGFLWGNMLFQSPSQIQGRGGSFDSWTIISGDIYNGVYEFTINVPQYAEAGEWRVLYFGGSDTTGNARYYYTEELAALGFPTIVTVLSDPSDITPPAVQSLDFTPKMIDVSAGSQSITVTARITDDLSGFLWGNMLFQSPSQIQGRGGSFDSWTIISGDIYNGVYEFTINVPQYAEAGEWRVLYFGGSDTTGNARYYYTEELAALGFPTVLTVSENQNPVADAGPDKTALVKEMVQFDGGSSSDPDGYIAAYVWDLGDGSPSATGILVSHAFAQAGQYTITLTVTDNEGATDVDQAVVVVKTPTTAVEDLMGEVKSGVAGDIQNSLISKLNSALDSLKKKNDTAAVNKLKAFINEVEAQKGKKIPSDVADHWIALANRIIAAVKSGVNSLQVLILGAPANVETTNLLQKPGKAVAEMRDFAVRVHVDKSSAVTVAIVDSKGNPVGMISGQYKKPGDYVLIWDGLDREGNPCPKGVYFYQVLGSFKPGGSGIIVIR